MSGDEQLGAQKKQPPSPHYDWLSGIFLESNDIAGLDNNDEMWAV
jgi:hypothetical protein